MTDGLIVGNRLAGVSWDGIWDAQTRIESDEWTAELEIPFKTLSFDPSVSTWGFHIERTITRVTEESRWAGSTLDSMIHAVSRAGDIAGLEGLSQGLGLDIKPYGLLGVNRDVSRPDQVKPVHDAGVDIFYRLTSNLLSSTTVNTDFAETEVDTRQVNLTRFSLLFPEKRAFFLEDAGVFQFGLPGPNSSLLPFHSRTIGLVGGRTVPISIGEKLTGKVGRLEMGLLDVVTRDSDVAPGRNLFVGRAKLDFWRESYVGAIFTHGEPTGRTDNSLAGADVVLSTSNFRGRRKNFDVAAFGMKTNTPGGHSGDVAYGAQIRYPNDFVELGYSWQDIGENFDPKLGYVRRRGVRINSLSTGLAPRPVTGTSARCPLASASPTTTARRIGRLNPGQSASARWGSAFTAAPECSTRSATRSTSSSAPSGFTKASRFPWIVTVSSATTSPIQVLRIAGSPTGSAMTGAVSIPDRVTS